MAELSNAFIIGHFVFHQRAALLKFAESMDWNHMSLSEPEGRYNTTKKVVK